MIVQFCVYVCSFCSICSTVLVSGAYVQNMIDSLQSVALFIIVLTLERNRAQKWHFEVDDSSTSVFLLLMLGYSFSVQFDGTIISSKIDHTGRKMIKIRLDCQLLDLYFSKPSHISCLNPRLQICYDDRGAHAYYFCNCINLTFCIRFCFLIKIIEKIFNEQNNVRINSMYVRIGIQEQKNCNSIISHSSKMTVSVSTD